MLELKAALAAFGRLFYEFDRFRFLKAKSDRESQADATKNDPEHAATERFGAPAGRVRVSVEPKPKQD
uniref:Uncharacterized protein n=1 Tax=Enterovibrio sp. FF_113 TaxID=1660266 RepID=A0A0H3ZW44_9GAMM|nr:hypothetical protein [Enterovibrio sp. FF_113]